MPKKKTVNQEKLIKAVESGMSSTEIMAKFGLKTSAQLKSLYLDALTANGRVKAIAGRSSKADPAAGKSDMIKVNKRGSLVIPRDLVEEMGFKLGDDFSVRKTKSGLSLRKN